MESIWQLLVICFVYILVAFITNRGLIAAPSYRLLCGRMTNCRLRATVLAQLSPTDAIAGLVASAVIARLDFLERNDTVVWRLSRVGWGVLSIPLSKLASAWRVLHAAERELMRLIPDTEVTAQAYEVAQRLRSAGAQQEERLAEQLVGAPDPETVRLLLIAALERLHDLEDTATEKDYEHQRVALWLTCVGLIGVVLVGLAFDHRPTMLMGALGGFLAPVVGTLLNRHALSWGALVLSPVGGALLAVGGLLLVRMLSAPEISLLGNVFFDHSWGASRTPMALCLALLFGFSGSLFSRLALTASTQLTTVRGGPVA
ncbi:hypothetical protein ACWCYZ_32120 [Streptomyces virginiae]